VYEWSGDTPNDDWYDVYFYIEEKWDYSPGVNFYITPDWESDPVCTTYFVDNAGATIDYPWWLGFEMANDSCCMPSMVSINTDPWNFMDLQINYTWPANMSSVCDPKGKWLPSSVLTSTDGIQFQDDTLPYLYYFESPNNILVGTY